MSAAVKAAALACCVAFATIPASGRASDPSASAIQALIDELAVIAVVDGIDRAVDARRWDEARAGFASSVVADFSSLTGAPAATIGADDLVGAWRANLKGTKTSLHLRTNHHVRLAGGRATVTSHGYAWNRMEGNGDPLWEVWGIYEHRLERTADGWRVNAMTFRMTHERGNSWVKTTPGR